MWRRALYACSVVAAAAAAQDLPRGTLIERVVCRGNEAQSYAAYIPNAYTKDRRWPILYCLDPGARGRLAVEHFQQAAERAGIIAIASNNSRNGPIEPVREAIRAMLTDTHARFSIDDGRVYAAGFSGGARVALAWALGGNIAGVIACGAAFSPDGEVPNNIPFRLYATAGVDDFNYYEMYAMSRVLAKRGIEHRFVELEGGHDWLTPATANEAFEFFAGRTPPRAAPDDANEKKQEALFRETVARFNGAALSERQKLVAQLKKDSSTDSDTPARRVARQTLGGAYVAAIENARASMDRKQYREAAQSWETCTVIRPDNPETWYGLARARAGVGDKKQAIDALGRAIENGFRDNARIAQEPLFDRVRNDARFQSITARMGALTEPRR